MCFWHANEKQILNQSQKKETKKEGKEVGELEWGEDGIIFWTICLV